MSMGSAALGLNLALDAEGPGGVCSSIPAFPWSCVPVPPFSEVQQ
jgi:hypothetical protein